MATGFRGVGWIALALSAVGASRARAELQPATRYRLLEGSALIVTLMGEQRLVPLEGWFDLFPQDEHILKHYTVRELRAIGPEFTTVVGGGDYWVGGEMPPDHRIVLDVLIDDGVRVHMDSGLHMASSRFPSIEITALQDPRDPVLNYDLHLIAVPAHPVWFSTEIEFHSGTHGGARVGHGDVLTSSGFILWPNDGLRAGLSIPGPDDIGVDALAPGEINGPPRWECWFSAEVGVWSDTLGFLFEGDFLSERGFVVARERELVERFQPDLRQVGLDAITWGWPCSGWYFSVERDFFSNALQRMVGHGDVLCARDGFIFMENRELLRNFQPVDPPANLGLDGLFLWTSGEIWFSVEEPGFLDRRWGTVSDGDLLSDSGWIVRRNLRLVERFAPLEDVNNFGLDALHVVPLRKGDMNGDARIDATDIEPFILALFDPAGYAQRYPEISRNITGDMNNDEVMNALDIEGFIAELFGG